MSHLQLSLRAHHSQCCSMIWLFLPCILALRLQAVLKGGPADSLKAEKCVNFGTF